MNCHSNNKFFRVPNSFSELGDPQFITGPKRHYYKHKYSLLQLIKILKKKIFFKVIKVCFIFSSVTHQQYNILTAKIIQCFPNESAQKYYYAGQSITEKRLYKQKGNLLIK